MGDLPEQMYCSQQIYIPPTYPHILKQYAKAAIRTQPYDLLRWSAAYFRALSNHEEPPVKVRLEYPPVETPSGITPGYLKVLLLQLAGYKMVPFPELFRIWNGMCLDEKAFQELVALGNFVETEEVDLLKFVAIAAGHITHSLSQTMILLCELLTEDPEGGPAKVRCDVFCELYRYLAAMQCGPPGQRPATQEEDEEGEDDKTEERVISSGQEIRGIGPVVPTDQIADVVKYMEYWADRQEGMVMPRNIRHFLCPPLDVVPIQEPR